MLSREHAYTHVGLRLHMHVMENCAEVSVQEFAYVSQL